MLKLSDNKKEISLLAHYLSKIHLLHLHRVVWGLEEWVLKYTHNLICSQLCIFQLLVFWRQSIKRIQIRGCTINTCGTIFFLEPEEELAISFIGLENVEYVSLLAEKAVYLIWAVVCIHSWALNVLTKLIFIILITKTPQVICFLQ